ncbi:baseplate wedge subunit [Cronobacter phage S13]|uniref:baseplate wedge subunit n=1 Tax=Cronobacter phage S13 TaxID=1327935 RepID=UPI00049A84E0|nr:baseplate wedge subunit [Cronobacter phage S13]AIA64900.1 putative baseplate wedge initiator [Cronobacter phage S13]
MIKAPSITGLKIKKLSANQVQLTWDSVGGNFYYLIEYAYVPKSGRLHWESLGYTKDTMWFEEKSIAPNTKYKFRISSTFNGFTPSDWVETEVFETFDTNVYLISKMVEFLPNNYFIRRKLGQNDKRYIDFNDETIQASLMVENFRYDPEIQNISNFSRFIMTDPERHEIQGPVPVVCSDEKRVMLTEIDGVLYAMERWQPVVKVSNDRGQNWIYYKAFNGRVGNPMSKTCTYQNDSTTYVLGYTEVFYGRKPSAIRFSSDIERWSNNIDTFAQQDFNSEVGFPVELFSHFALYPADITMKVEAQACNSRWLYAVARDKVRRIDIVVTPLDADGRNAWDPETYRITGDDLAITKKLDMLNEKMYALVVGRLKGANLDPTIQKNVDYSADIKGVYQFDDVALKWNRVFGNTKEERDLINEFSNMSTNGKDIFFSSMKFKFPGTLKDEHTMQKYPTKVSDAVRFNSVPGYNSTKKIHFNLMRSEDGINWKRSYQRYYNEAIFSWMRRSHTRTWITHDMRAAVIYEEFAYTKTLDPDKEIQKETWDTGTVTFNLPDVRFENFIKYTNGIMIHNINGDVIGYYELPYRSKDTLNIFWKPSNTMMICELQNQERVEPFKPKLEDGLRDPDLRPLIDTMAPEEYIYDDGLFRQFNDYYLQFISEGTDSYYNKLLNLIKNKYPREADSYEYLWSEIRRRNIYLDKEKREQVVKFFETRSTDFYSTKGIKESYTFLFKLLYNEDVEIDFESSVGIDYDIIVESANIDQDIVGRTVYTPTGRANVTYYERLYEEGMLKWKITIHNLIGEFMAGQELKSERTRFTGTITRGVRGKEVSYSSIDYLNRKRSYYVMKIKSQLSMSRYKDDVIRFVHPVGFGFVGITLLTMFVNAGLSMRHSETILTLFKTLRWDAGLPSEYPEMLPRKDLNGNIMFNEYNVMLEDPNPLKGAYDVKEWEDQAKSELGLTVKYDSIEATVNGKKPSERRVKWSPQFDGSWSRFSALRHLVDQRYKDDLGNPRDVSHAVPKRQPTQYKVPE